MKLIENFKKIILASDKNVDEGSFVSEYIWWRFNSFENIEESEEEVDDNENENDNKKKKN